MQKKNKKRDLSKLSFQELRSMKHELNHQIEIASHLPFPKFGSSRNPSVLSKALNKRTTLQIKLAKIEDELAKRLEEI